MSQIKSGFRAGAKPEIGGNVFGIQGASDAAVTGTGSDADKITGINKASAAVSAAVGEAGAAARGIDRNIEQASAVTPEVPASKTKAAQASREIGNRASQVISAAKELSRQSAVLHGVVNKFLISMREVN